MKKLESYFTGWHQDERTGEYTFEVNFDDEETEEQTIAKLVEFATELCDRPGYRLTDAIIGNQRRDGKSMKLQVWFCVDARTEFSIEEESNFQNEWMLFNLDLTRTTLRGIKTFARELKYGRPLMLADTKGQGGIKQLGIRSDEKVRKSSLKATSSKNETPTKPGSPTMYRSGDKTTKTSTKTIYRGVAVKEFSCPLVLRPALEVEEKYCRKFWEKIESSYKQIFPQRALELALKSNFDEYLRSQAKAADLRMDDLSNLVSSKTRRLLKSTKLDSGKTVEDDFLVSEVSQKIMLKLLYEGRSEAIDPALVSDMVKKAASDIDRYMRNLSSYGVDKQKQYEESSNRYPEGKRYMDLEEAEAMLADRGDDISIATQIWADKETRKAWRRKHKRQVEKAVSVEKDDNPSRSKTKKAS